MQATAQCGVPLEVLENALRAKGYTTGHSPCVLAEKCSFVTFFLKRASRRNLR
jgi:hypothetical protein